MSFTYDRLGNRKYITVEERKRFLDVARAQAPRPVYTFCLVLALTGARISEALSLTPRRIDFEAGLIVIRSLKKRDSLRPVYRAIPVPAKLLAELDATHEIRAAQQDVDRSDARIWPWCRTTAWKEVKAMMQAAGITGLQASPKALRHGFATAAIGQGVPLHMVQKWLGHSRIETTAIYTQAVGPEERAIARRMWSKMLPDDLSA